MQIFVKAKPGAKKEGVVKIDETHFRAAVREPSRENRANRAIIKVLAKYFGISASRVCLLSGFSSRQKKFEIQ